ncbi:cation-translocating P-type ATPase [Geotalea uraniireducens]|uniref:ATPase, P-type (Transporting), HAD superfamily, subfamily IC n=1 Tax=Geotalea uraniireducens (strain Rf4) TaxID=351605 RepID=A5G4K4_GEOUR|nr:cation-translocating P-type ATPase [Geotalea uraniireducens]ABQ26722.1 ATPase, P-type (transporting), HAD superfamily, subfamily IC [Geotalea uraniireducens Rf4]
MEWHQLSIEDVFAEFRSSRQGLSDGEAEQRLTVNGPNELLEKRARMPLVMFLSQFGDFMILVLLGAAFLAGSTGNPGDMLLIIAIVILNAIIGFIQEFRAERAIIALKRMAGQVADVLRAGQLKSIDAREIVPGDLVLLKTGDVVPADLRLVDGVQLKLVESSLTGESFPVEKDGRRLSDPRLPLGERKNMAYKGTIVSAGRGMGIVVATGMATELGKIAAMIQAEGEAKTPLQRRLAAFGRRLAVVVLFVCAMVFIIGYLRGESPLLMFMTAISLAVAVIPEALPAVVTISLALGAGKMVKQNALIRRLPAVETLGAITYICTDKTGTLTQNRMTVTELFLDGAAISPGFAANGAGGGAVDAESTLSHLLIAAALCNDARKDNGDNMTGDPTDVALYVLALGYGLDPLRLAAQFPRIAELPFDSDRKCMTSFHHGPDGIVSFTKGAVEALVDRAGGIMSAAGVEHLDRGVFIRQNELMAASGMRVLAVAMRKWDKMPGSISSDVVERDLTMLGLAGMTDPPREEALPAVSLCRSAGIVPVMITGDHPVTALAIARKLEMLEEDGERMLTGRELDDLSLEEFERRVEHIRVYARVAPEQKLKIVQALKDKGHFVAMTGDGVNDAPALKRADIGIAMGMTGTDVAKEAAAMILLDDNFATIVNAVREGRRIYANILKFITYSITSNMGTLVLVVLAPFFGMPLPLLPVQILWLNLLCDSLPGLALAVEPAERDTMCRPPVNPAAGIFAEGRWWFMARYGLMIGALALSLQAYASGRGLPWQTMVFSFLVISRMAMAVSVRSDRLSLFQLGLFGNIPLVGAIIITCALQSCVVWIPALNSLFSTSPLSFTEFSIILVLSSVVLLVTEAEKLILSRRRNSRVF